MNLGIDTKYTGYIDSIIRFIENARLSDDELWKRFVDQFKLHSDTQDFGWRGEYWGKMMCGACGIYSYTKDRSLYESLKNTVSDMLAAVEQSGKLSTYEGEREFTGWDIWNRKNVLLGLLYFTKICDDKSFVQDITDSMCNQLDYIISKIGLPEEGKTPINTATNHWRGLNSSSILEPVVMLYNLTKKQAYFDFAKYIVESGGTSVVNIFMLAYENKFYPYQYPVTKAYEMTSCFEGLLEYYKITKTDWYKTAVINFANRILESDFTIIGSSGCTHELFDHSAVRQANTTNGKIMQETCVTVTLMKFFAKLNLLTGSSRYADAFETSMYNAYLGSVNTENSIEPSIGSIFPDAVIEPLPFDSYSPLTAGTRGNGIGGLKLMSDKHYFGCCACMGAVGAGLIPKFGFLKKDNGFIFNLFIPGEITAKTKDNTSVVFTTETDYPKSGEIKIKLSLNQPEEFCISIRNPHWSTLSSVAVNKKAFTADGEYIKINRIWKDNDVIDISFNMQTEIIKPIPYGHQILMNHVVWGQNYVIPSYDEEDTAAKKHIALKRGPVILAMDNRLGKSVDEPINIDKSGRYIDTQVLDEANAPYPCLMEVSIKDKNNNDIFLTDYASAGKLWNEESKMAAWLLTDD